MRFLNGKGWMLCIWPESFRLPTETDSGGPHQTHVLLRLAAFTFAFLLFTFYFSASAQNKAEYFFDTDPGPGNGTSLTMAAGDSVTINPTISVASLTTGFHVLYVRSRMGGRWSQAEARGFYKMATVASVSRKIKRFEYFFDTDPGVGSGFQITGFTTGDSVENTRTISISSLASGFHTLYIRSQDETNAWSQTETRPFYITPTTTASSGPISRLEYFFDTDPGVGAGTSITVSSADSSEKIQAIPISALASGFHTIYVRAKNNRGWSLTESRTFFITTSTSLNAGPISRLEYFFDTDPGVGLATSITVSSADSSEKTSVIPVSSLASGFHTLYIRAKNNKGWSQTESRSFYVYPASQTASGPVAKMEYFIDTDPGVGLGTALSSFTSGDSVQVTRVIPVPSNLATGVHKLYIRSQTSDKRWAITEVQDFTVDCAEISITATQTQICSGASTTLSFASGNQPGTYQWYRNGTLISGANAFSYTTTQTGGYTLRYQFGSCLDTSDVLAIGVGTAVTATATASGSTNICAGSTVNLNANSGTGLTYQWLMNNNIISGQTGIQLANVAASGSYSVIVTNATGCKDTSNVIQVTVTPLPPKPSISAGGPTTFCDGGSVVLTTTAASGRWSTGETTQSITVSGSAIIRDTAIVNGCKIVSDPITITENPCNDLPGSGNAVVFDGIDDKIVLTSPDASQKPSRITVEAWVYSVGLPGDYAGIVTNVQDNSSDEAGFYLTRRSSGNVEFLVRSENGGFTGPSAPLSQNQWVHVAGVYDGANVSIYVNGILRGQSSLTGNIKWTTNQPNTIYTIGAYVDANEDYSFQGKIDEVRVWNIARTQAQIQADMCRKIATPPASLIAYFNFDEASGNSTFSQAGPDVDGTLTNGAVREVSGAPVGDDATALFQASGLPSVTFTNGTQETFNASFTAGTATGDRGGVVYIVREKPSSTNGITGIGTNDRYYGVFAAGITSPQYTAVYNYGTNPFVTAGNENSLALFKRNDNSVTTWTNAFGVRNTTANTMTVTGESTEYMLGIGAGGEVNPGTIGSDQTISCSNIAPAAFTSLADATTTTGFPITYQWQDSTKGGSWQDIASATASTFTPPLLNDTTWYRRKATASMFSQFTNILVVNVQAVVAGDPTVYPNGTWNVYAWNGADINLGTGLQYRGFYTIGGLNVNTTNQWNNGSSPSSASSWQGCPVQVDNFTWSFRRRGFPTGNYVINVPGHDDQIGIFVNGTQVYTANCCGPATNVTLGELGISDSVEVRMVEFGGGAAVIFDLVLSNLVAGSIGSDQLICANATPAALANIASASGGPTTSITYQWQDSTKNGSWQNIASATALTLQPPPLTDTTWYRRVAHNGPQSAASNAVQIAVNSPAGDPAVYPTNSWNIYSYTGQDLALSTSVVYNGFYSINTLNFNTQNQWGAGASPSSAAGYQGCPTPVDGFIFSAKRKGFPGGNYTLNIPAHDDYVQVYKNGIMVFEHLGCCDSHSGIDMGALNASTELEFRVLEGSGSAVLQIELIASAFQGGEIAADQNVCSGNAPLALTSVSEAGGGGITNIAYQWQDSTAGGSWQNIDAATGLGYQPEILTVSTHFRRRAIGNSITVFSNEVLVAVLPAPTVVVAPAGPINFCQGESQTLTGTFSTGSTRQWLRNNVVISGQTAATLVVAQSGTYKAVALNGSCTDTSNSVVINVNPKPAPIITPGGPLTLCQGSTIDLDWANPVSGQTIQWKKDGAPISGGNTLSANSAGSYYLVATFTASGCKDSSNVVVINIINPTVTPVGPVTVCDGSSQTLTVANVGTASLQWFRNNAELTGETNPTIDITTGGIYRVDASVGTTCTVSSNDVVANLVTPPQAVITPPSTNEFCAGGSITLEANTGTGLSYQWKRNTQNINGATSATLLVNQSGDYTVVVTNAGNCSATSAIVTITEVQNVTWFMDVDGDHYGAGVTVQNCTRPLNGFLASELTATTGDCNDNDASINPDRQFFTFSGGQGFASALTSPLVGTSYTSFRFEVKYTNLNNNAPPATFPRVVLDFEGNGQLNNPNDRTIIMQQADTRDNNTSDGKIYFATVNSLAPGQNYTTRILTSVGNCATTIGPFNYPDVFILSDIQIFANDITFDNTNPDVSSPLQISAVVHNVSDFAAQNFVVHLTNQYNPGIVYPDIVVANLAPHSEQTVVWNITTPPDPAWCPMQVDIDFTDVIDETNELDNSAIRPFVNGPFNVPGEIVLHPSVSPGTVVGVSGASVTLVGVANYSGTAVPLQDPSVAGAQVTFTVTPGGQTYTTYTNSSGQINFSFYVPLTPGVYTITGTITDFTLTTNFTTTFVVVPPPASLADLVADVSVSNTNIVEGESITGNIRVTNVGEQPTVDSTWLTVSQSGGLPLLVNVKVPPLAVNAFFDTPIPAITFDDPGTYSICGTADGTFLVNEQSEGNNTGCKIISVIPFLPDIYPTSCGVGGSIYLNSQTYTHTFSFHNSGGSATGPFTVRIVRSFNGNPLDTFDRPVANIARQSGGSVSIDVTYDQLGTYSYFMACDIPVPPGVVAETNEDNNTSTCQLGVLAPQTDLYVQGCENFDVDPVDPPFPGSITLKALVGNGGNLTATAPITVRFTRTSGTVEDVVINNNLAPGQTVVVTKTVPATAPGTDTARVTVDPQNVFNEFNEGNNTTSNLLCHESAPVDNYCGGNWWSNTYLINQAIFLNVPVVVRGMYNISELKVRFFVSGPGLSGTINLGDATLNNLTETCYCPYIATLPVNFAFPAEGLYTFTFITDPDNLYTECNESNNTLVKTVKVSGLPDMRMLSQGINPSLLNPDVGEPITIDANYENIGLANIDQVMKVKLLVDEIAIDSQTVHGLVTGDNFTVNFATPWSSTLVGSHIIRTIIDADNVVEENNETNNEATRAVIVGAAANLYFQVFQPSNSNPALNQNININARIGNAGDVEVEGAVIFYYINNQGDTVQITIRSVALDAHDSVTLSVPWTVADNNTILIGKIINASVMEFNYEDNMATAPIGGFGVTLTSTPSCAGKPNGTLTATPTGGTAPFTYQWSSGFTGDSVLTSGPGLYNVQVTDANSVSVLVSGSIPNLPGKRYFLDADGDGHGNAGVDSIDCVQPPGYVVDSLDCNDNNIAVYKKTGKPSISHSGNLTFCSGGSVTLSVGQLAGVNYLWSTNESGSSIVVSTAGTFTVTATQDSGCAATSEPIVTNLITSLVPTASISVSPDSVVCTGTQITFTASTSGGGSNPVSEWLVNGTVAATGGTTFSGSNFNNNDRVELRYISSESCASPDTVVSNFIRLTIGNTLVANAGPDQTICTDTTTLAATGSGVWSFLDGDPEIVSPNSATSKVDFLEPGLNRFVWTVTSGNCPSATDTVNIFVLPAPSQANAGSDDFTCSSTTGLDAEFPQIGTGTWSVISGTAIVTDPGSTSSDVTNLSPGQNVLVWSVANGSCPPSTDTLIITRFAEPSLANAGPDQTICPDSTDLGADVPNVGTGLWTVVTGSAVLSDPTSATSAVHNLSTGLNQFVWTISNGSCSASTDTVNVVVTLPASIHAGNDTTICSSGLVLQPNPTGGSWMVLTGGGTLSGDTANGMSIGVNELVYTVAFGGGCVSTDTIRITRVDSTETIHAGPDQILCSQTTTTLAATAPQTGTGAWSVISGTAVVTDPSNPTSEVTGLSFGEHVLRWTVTNNPCPAHFDEVTISVTDQLVANAGPDSTICGNSITVTGNGQGVWSLVSGLGTITSPTSATTSITGLAVGANIFQWKLISNGCPSDSDQVTITVNEPAGIANAGPDQTLCTDSTTLAGNAPLPGTGMWTVLSGAATITNPGLATSTVKNLGTGENQLVWTIMNSCGENSDTVSLFVQPPASLANAGPDQSVCDTTTILEAEEAQSGTGTWAVLSGTGNFSSINQANATVTGLAIGNNVFVWTVAVGSCPGNSDTVVIHRADSLPQPDAGFDQLLCGNEVTLSASPSAFAGSGMWTQVAGSGAIQNPANAQTLVTGLGIGGNKFVWTISNNVCADKTDTVVITMEEPPSEANAGADQIVCTTTTQLAADLPTAGNGTWTVLSGGATVEDPTSPTSVANNLAIGSNVLVWSVSNGLCPASTDTVVISVSAPIGLVFAGIDTAICGSTFQMNAQAPLTGSWSSVSGTVVFQNAGDPQSLVSNLEPGSNQLIWTAGLAPCPVKSDTIVVQSNPSVAANAGLSILTCSDTATLSASSAGSFGFGQWSVETGTATFTDPSVANTLVSNLSPGLNVLRWTVFVPTCPTLSDTMSIVRLSDSLNIHVDTAVCFNIGDSLVLSVPQGITNFTWSTGQTSPTIVLYAADTVVLTVVTPQNCTLTDTIRVQGPICDPVKQTMAGKTEINIYPNPSAGRFVLEVNGFVGKEIAYTIWSVSGVAVGSGRHAGGKSTVEIPIDTASLPSGIYFLETDLDGFRSRTKLVLEK